MSTKISVYDFIATLFLTAKTRTQPTHLLTEWILKNCGLLIQWNANQKIYEKERTNYTCFNMDGFQKRMRNERSQTQRNIYYLVTLKVQEYMKLIYSDGNQKSIISRGGTGWEMHETIFSFWMDVTLLILN